MHPLIINMMRKQSVQVHKLVQLLWCHMVRDISVQFKPIGKISRFWECLFLCTLKPRSNSLPYHKFRGSVGLCTLLTKGFLGLESYLVIKRRLNKKIGYFSVICTIASIFSVDLLEDSTIKMVEV